MEGVARIMTGHMINMRREIRLWWWRREREKIQIMNKQGQDGMGYIFKKQSQK